jgi:hypothetical protein
MEQFGFVGQSNIDFLEPPLRIVSASNLVEVA